MPVTTLEGRHSNAVGEGCLTSPTAWAQRWASSRQCESVELTEARSQASRIPARIQRDDNRSGASAGGHRLA